jgi:Mrp family chromosome partitioning ATPase
MIRRMSARMAPPPGPAALRMTQWRMIHMTKPQGEDIVRAINQKAARQAQDAQLSASLERIRQTLVVMSGKGGVGKTSTAVNLAIALSERGHAVGLMDVDLHGPDVPRMLGLMSTLEPGPDQKIQPLVFSERLRVVSIESFMPRKDDAVIWRGPLKYSAIRQFITEVNWGALDFLIIDAPPGTGDEPLTVAQSIRQAQAVIVTTPQEVSLADVRKSISFCQTVGMQVFGLIENMSGFACPHCGQEIDLFGSGGGERTARDSGIRFLGRIPFDPEVVSCGDAGASLLRVHPEAPVARAFTQIAATIASTLDRPAA